jgi:hypothetical protein
VGWLLIVTIICLVDLSLGSFFFRHPAFIIFEFGFFFIRSYKIVVVWCYCVELKELKRKLREEAELLEAREGTSVVALPSGHHSQSRVIKESNSVNVNPGDGSSFSARTDPSKKSRTVVSHRV